MELPGKQQHRYFINQELADRVKDLVVGILSCGRDDAAALAVADHAHSLADHLISYFESENPLPQPIACRAGCDCCCYNLVELTPPEALLIGDFIDQHFSAAEKKVLLDRVARTLARTAGQSKAAIAARRGDLPCPLLRDRQCMVYPVRPLVCRAMHGLDAARCEAELQSGSLAASSYYAHRHEIAVSVSAGVREGCRAAGCQSDTLNLAQALHDFFTQDNPAERWIIGEEVFIP
jgi:Fe-S-cluster containining protein